MIFWSFFTIMRSDFQNFQTLHIKHANKEFDLVNYNFNKFTNAKNRNKNNKVKFLK